VETVAANAQADRAPLKTAVTWSDILGRVAQLRAGITSLPEDRPWYVFGIPRGGCAIAPLFGIPVDDPADADLIVDDVIDSGATISVYRKIWPDTPIAALFDKRTEAGLDWLVFPWEANDENGGPRDNVVRILQYLGVDPASDGLHDTPDRVIRAMAEMTEGYREDPAVILAKTFDQKCDEIVMVRNVPFTSLCEHHLMPFVGEATIGYLPGERVVGLSKLARLLDCYAKRLQIQERMTAQIADAIQHHLQARGVGVVVRAHHACMSARGIRKQGDMVTSALRGSMKEGSLRAEFLSLAER